MESETVYVLTSASAARNLRSSASPSTHAILVETSGPNVRPPPDRVYGPAYRLQPANPLARMVNVSNSSVAGRPPAPAGDTCSSSATSCQLRPAREAPSGLAAQPA